MVSCGFIIGSAVLLTYGSLCWMQYRALRDNLGKDVDANASIYEWQAPGDVSHGCHVLFNTLRASCVCLCSVLCGIVLTAIAGVIFSTCNVVFNNSRFSSQLTRALSLSAATLQIIWGAAILIPNLCGVTEVVFRIDWHFNRVDWTCTECLPCTDIHTAAVWTFWPLAFIGLVGVVGGLGALKKATSAAHLKEKVEKDGMGRGLAMSESSQLMPRY